MKQENEAKKNVKPGLIPAPGFSWNPLTRYPRNQKCYCGSLKKAKLCCLKSVERALPTDSVISIKNNWNEISCGKMKIEMLMPEQKTEAQKV